ncbi:MAG: hypothetical protein AMXMBFR61_09480 [Fimbriimonadales bacterium]
MSTRSHTVHLWLAVQLGVHLGEQGVWEDSHFLQHGTNRALGLLQESHEEMAGADLLVMACFGDALRALQGFLRLEG